MFLFKILGVFDILAGIVIIFTLGDIPFRLILGHSLYLILKAYIFKGDILSIIDASIGIYGIFALVIIPIPFISVLAGLYLVGKGCYSLI